METNKLNAMESEPNVSSYSVIVGARKTYPLLIFYCWATKYRIRLLHKVNKETPLVIDGTDILIDINRLLNHSNNFIKGARKTDPLLIYYCWATKYRIPLLQKVNKKTPRITD